MKRGFIIRNKKHGRVKAACLVCHVSHGQGIQCPVPDRLWLKTPPLTAFGTLEGRSDSATW
jgi:hypothetical protein